MVNKVNLDTDHKCMPARYTVGQILSGYLLKSRHIGWHFSFYWFVVLAFECQTCAASGNRLGKVIEECHKNATTEECKADIEDPVCVLYLDYSGRKNNVKRFCASRGDLNTIKRRCDRSSCFDDFCAVAMCDESGCNAQLSTTGMCDYGY